MSSINFFDSSDYPDQHPDQSQSNLSGYPDQPQQQAQQPDSSGYPDQPSKEEPSLMSKWDKAWINQPLSKKITYKGVQIFDPEYAANYYDPPSGRTSDQWKIPDWVPFAGGGTWRSLGAGMLEGAGKVIESATTPLNLATMGALKGASLATQLEAPATARGLHAIGRTLSVPFAASGAAKVGTEFTGDKPVNWTNVGTGVGEMAGGLAGAVSPYHGAVKSTNKPVIVPPTPVEFQPRLPGTEGLDFGETGGIDFGEKPPRPNIPPPDTPAQTRARAFSDIDTQTSQRVLELKILQSEASRNGDHATATALSNDILKAQMDASVAKRNWQPSPEPAPPEFADISGPQGELPYNLWRSQGKFTSPADVTPEMRQGVPRPSPFTFNEPTPAPDVAPEPAVTTGAGPDELPSTISTRGLNPDQVKALRDRGYVSVPGLRDENNFPMMARGDIPPSSFTEQLRASAARGPIPPGARTVPPSPEGSLIDRLATEESGMFTPVEMIQNIKQKLRQLMGREPSPEEVDNEVEQRRAELAPRPGETTGRVAQFGPQVGEPPPTNDFMNIRSATDVPAATENVQYWRDRLNASRLTGDPEIARHADDMLGVAERHLASLRGRAGIPLTELPVRGQFPDVGPADLPAQRGLPFGPAELRARTQLENISNAPPSEAVDLGPQPTQESFNFNKSPKELPPMGGSETGAIDFGGTLQAIREKTGIGGTPLTEKQLAAKKAQIARNKEAGYRPGTTAGDEVLGLAKSATTIADFSGMKQVASQWMTPEFRRGVLKMVGATFSDKFDNAIHAELQSKDMFQHELDANNNPLPSWADRVGFKLIGKGKDLGGRTEMIASNWMENGRFFGLPDNPVSRFYSKTYGNVARGSTRGFRTMINYVAANRLEFLANNAREMAIQGATTGKTPMPGIMGGVHLPKWMGGQRVGGFNQKVTLDQAMDLNPYTNIELGRHLSDFVRTATGQAPLKFHIYPGRGGEWNLEGHTRLLTRTLFAPRSLFQKFRMMNPNTYIMAPPMVRKEYMKAALSSIAGWIAITNMVKAASPAMGNNVRVSWNPDNSDFGKIRIGNTRLDFGQGYLPFLVMGYRWLTGHYTSSATGITHQYGQGFQAQTQLGQTGRTIVGNKLEPFLAFATDLMGATEQQPFHVGDRAMQLAIPMAAQDIWDIAHANPSLGPTGLGMIPPILAGAASQTYGRKSGPRFISGQHDLVIKHPSILGGFK